MWAVQKQNNANIRMRNILIIFFLFLSYNVVAQTRPTGVPTQFSTGWFRWGYAQADSGLIPARRDTTFLPRFTGTIVMRPQNRQFYYYDSTDLRWYNFGTNIDTTSLSNRINLKLNISDTGTMLSPYLRKIDTTNKWVQDVYVRNDSLFKFKNGTETFLDTLGNGGSGSGLTSVGLSMPSAFTVTGSPLTSNGTINVSGAGITAQYIRGNGTLATTDTGMIPNFYLKVRSLLSGTSPITYNSTTGAIGIPNANNTGQKGAATFNNSDFTDNGAGLISLRNPSGTPGVDTILRTPGVDSIYFTINGVQYAILDSLGAGGGSGTVTNVSGTTNRITVTNPTTTPVIDIAATYVGQSSITTLGTITTGTWNGTTIGATFGGTNQTTVTTGDLLYGSASNTWGKLAGVATGNALISGGISTAPSWGKIGLTTHVSGILPVVNGGTGTATPSLVAGTNITITGSWPNQTINAIATASQNIVDTVNKYLPTGDIYSTAYYLASASQIGLDSTWRIISDGATVRFERREGGIYVDKGEISIEDDIIVLDSVPFIGGNWDAFGDSYTAGVGASPSGNAYIPLLETALSMTANNVGESGTGIMDVQFKAYRDFPAFGQENRNPTTILIGFNDYLKSNSGTATQTMFPYAFRAFIFNHFLDTALASNDPGLTTTGSWSTFNLSASYPQKSAYLLSGTGRLSVASTAGDSKTYSFDGENVGFIFLGANGTTQDYGRLKVEIDGVAVDTVDENGIADDQSVFANSGTRTEDLISAAVVYTGLNNGSHTMKLSLLDNKNTNLDAFGVMASPAQSQSLVVGSIEKLLSAGYTAMSGAHPKNDAGVDATNTILLGVVNEFRLIGYKVVFDDVNVYTNPSTDIGVDNIHWNNSGHLQGKNSFRAKIIR
jgi:hypothetical protein